MFLIVARETFGFTKRHFLCDKVQPDNRAVLITGCDSGFGNALAKRLDTKGYHVFASCLNSSGTGAVELKNYCSKRLQILELDVTKEESVKKALEFVKANLGTSELWALVNNAGIYKGISIELTDLKDFEDNIAVNTLGPVRVTKAFLPLLRQSRGRVVNVASLAGRIAVPHVGPYTMSKFANVAFSDCLRNEMEVWGVRVVSIEPEAFTTPMANVENVLKMIGETISSIDEDVKSDYGEKYLEHLTLLMAKGGGIPSTKVYKVVNALELAISLECPDSVYRPSRNFALGLLRRVFELMPNVTKDLILKACIKVAGYP